MMEWNYLLSEPYRARYALAAWFLRECPAIVEIGGYKTPITGFVTYNIPIIVIDPRIEAFSGLGIEHAACRWQDWKGRLPTVYGAAILGVELDEDPRNCPSLISMLAKAQRVVLEWVTDYVVAAGHAEQIIEALNRPVLADITLTIAGKVDAGDGWPPRGNRRMIVLE